ncbi:MAG: nitrile hydratase subunit beta [Pseudomonadota bacterium]
MNGAQDLGGMMGFGPVEPEADEPLFHGEWEKRVLACTVAMGGTGAWNLDQSRHARESIPPADYLSFSYYEIWLAGLLKLLEQRSLVSAEEMAAGKALQDAKQLPRVLTADKIDRVLAAGGPVDRPAQTEAAFEVDDAVTAKNIHPAAHTRLPRYVRGRPGRIHAVHGVHVFPDSNAAGKGEDPQWLYSVAFSATDLWGADADPRQTVYVDLWEPYLDPA